MARLRTAGAELQSPRGEGATLDTSQGTIGVDTTIKRQGRASFKFSLASGQNTAAIRLTHTAQLDRRFWVRAYVYFEAWPAENQDIIAAGAGASILTTTIGVKVTPTGMLQRGGSVNVQQLALNTWYRVEMSCVKVTSPANQWQGEVRVDGGAPVTLTNASFASAFDSWHVGLMNASAGAAEAMFADDLAVNDDTGSDQNSYPGEGRVLAALPLADSAVGSDWKRADGTALAGGDGVAVLDNAPPTGKATPTNADQIKDIVAATASPAADADFAMQSYDEVGVPAGSPIALVQAQEWAAASVALDQLLQTLSNPAGAGITFTNPGASPSTWPSGWNRVAEAPVYAPAVTRATRPVVRFGKRTSTVSPLWACSLALLVEYAEAPQLPAAAASAVASATLALGVSAPLAPAAASAVASASVALGAGGQPVAVAPASAVASASLTLTAPVVAAPTGPANPPSMML